MNQITKSRIYINFLALLLLTLILPTVEFARTTNVSYNGLSGYPTSIENIDNIIERMKVNGQNLYRMSFNPEWFTRKPHPYKENYIQYFLDHSNFMIIVDRNHLYPPNENSALAAQQNWDIVRKSIFNVLKTWPNNSRVAVELINEYVSGDFYTHMQNLVDEIRDLGYTNPIVVNKWNQPWTKINDPLDLTYQGYHFYFNSWSVSGAISQMKNALGKDLKIINTEVGASFNEYNDFNFANVDRLNNFLTQCAELGIGNTIWMNENLNNWKTYRTLNLKLPTILYPFISTPSPSPVPLSSASPSPSPVPLSSASPSPSPVFYPSQFPFSFQITTPTTTTSPKLSASHSPPSSQTPFPYQESNNLNYWGFFDITGRYYRYYWY